MSAVFFYLALATPIAALFGIIISLLTLIRYFRKSPLGPQKPQSWLQVTMLLTIFFVSLITLTFYILAIVFVFKTPFGVN